MHSCACTAHYTASIAMMPSVTQKVRQELVVVVRAILIPRAHAVSIGVHSSCSWRCSAKDGAVAIGWITL